MQSLFFRFSFPVKLCALTTALIFLGTSLDLHLLSAQVPVVQAPVTEKVRDDHSSFIPEKWGKVDIQSFYTERDSNKNSKLPDVIFIQDAHDSLEAQENISNIISHLVEEKGIRTVFEEGYEGKFPTEKYFGMIQNRDHRQKVSYFLLDHLRIGGAEYAHINRTHDFELIGADSHALHDQNLLAFKEASKYQKEIARDLKEIENELAIWIQEHFSKQMKGYLKVRKKFETGQLDFVSFIQRILQFYREDFSEFPSLSLLFKRLAGSTGDYSSQISFRELYAEVESLEEKIAEKYLKTTQEIEAFRHYRRLMLFHKLNHLSLSSEEYSFLQSFDQPFVGSTRDIGEFVSTIKNEAVVFSKVWESRIHHAVSFYETANLRDEVVGQVIDRHYENESGGSVILVYGGFHKGRIQDLLEAKGLSYAVVSPNIEAMSERHQKLYQGLMRGGAYTFEQADHSFTLPIHASRALSIGRRWDNLDLNERLLEMDFIFKQLGLSPQFPVLEDRKENRMNVSFDENVPSEIQGALNQLLETGETFLDKTITELFKSKRPDDKSGVRVFSEAVYSSEREGRVNHVFRISLQSNGADFGSFILYKRLDTSLERLNGFLMNYQIADQFSKENPDNRYFPYWGATAEPVRLTNENHIAWLSVEDAGLTLDAQASVESTEIEEADEALDLDWEGYEDISSAENDAMFDVYLRALSDGWTVGEIHSENMVSHINDKGERVYVIVDLEDLARTENVAENLGEIFLDYYSPIDANLIAARMISLSSKYFSDKVILSGFNKFLELGEHDKKSYPDLQEHLNTARRLRKERQLSHARKLAQEMGLKVLVRKGAAHLQYDEDYEPPQFDFDLDVIAHGTTDNNVRGVFHGSRTDNEHSRVNDAGLEESEEGAKAFWEDYAQLSDEEKNNVVFLRTPSFRTEQTKGIYDKIGDEVHQGDFDVLIDETAREIDFGLFDGLTHDEVINRFGTEHGVLSGAYRRGDVSVRFPDGQSFIEYLAQVKAWLETQNEKFAGKRIVLFGHGTFSAAVEILLKTNRIATDNQNFLAWRDYHPNRGHSVSMHRQEKRAPRPRMHIFPEITQPYSRAVIHEGLDIHLRVHDAAVISLQEVKGLKVEEQPLNKNFFHVPEKIEKGEREWYKELVKQLRHFQLFMHYHNKVLLSLHEKVHPERQLLRVQRIKHEMEHLVKAFVDFGLNSEADVDEVRNHYVSLFAPLIDEVLEEKTTPESFMKEMRGLWNSPNRKRPAEAKTLNSFINWMHQTIERNVFYGGLGDARKRIQGVAIDLKKMSGQGDSLAAPLFQVMEKDNDIALLLYENLVWVKRPVGVHSENVFAHLVEPENGGKIIVSYTEGSRRNRNRLRLEFISQIFEALGFTVNTTLKEVSLTGDYRMEATYDKDSGAFSLKDIVQTLQVTLSVLSHVRALDQVLLDVSYEDDYFARVSDGRKLSIPQLDARDQTGRVNPSIVEKNKRRLDDSNLFYRAYDAEAFRKIINAWVKRIVKMNGRVPTGSFNGILWDIKNSTGIDDTEDSPRVIDAPEKHPQAVPITIYNRDVTWVWGGEGEYADIYDTELAEVGASIHRALNAKLETLSLPQMPRFSPETFGQKFIDMYFNDVVAAAFSTKKIIHLETGEFILNPVYRPPQPLQRFIEHWKSGDKRDEMLMQGALVRGRDFMMVGARPVGSIGSGQLYVKEVYGLRSVVKIHFLRAGEDMRIVSAFAEKNGRRMTTEALIRFLVNLGWARSSLEDVFLWTADEVEELMQTTIGDGSFFEIGTRSEGLGLLPGVTLGYVTFDSKSLRGEQNSDKVLVLSELHERNIMSVPASQGFITANGNTLDHMNLRAGAYQRPRINLPFKRGSDESGPYIEINVVPSSKTDGIKQHLGYRVQEVDSDRSEDGISRKIKIREGSPVALNGDTGSLSFFDPSDQRNKHMREAFDLAIELKKKNRDRDEDVLDRLENFIEKMFAAKDSRPLKLMVRHFILPKRMNYPEVQSVLIQALVKHVDFEPTVEASSTMRFNQEMLLFMKQIYHYSLRELDDVLAALERRVVRARRIDEIYFDLKQVKKIFEIVSLLQSQMKEVLEDSAIVNLDNTLKQIRRLVWGRILTLKADAINGLDGVDRIKEGDSEKTDFELYFFYKRLYERFVEYRSLMTPMSEDYIKRFDELRERLKKTEAQHMEKRNGHIRDKTLSIPLEEINPFYNLLTGNKAANLGWLINFVRIYNQRTGANFRVPEGHALTRFAYELILKSPVSKKDRPILKDEIQNVLDKDLASTTKSNRIMNFFKEVKFPKKLKNLFARLFSRGIWAFRSSTTIEDAADRSAAGVFETELGVNNLKGMKNSARSTWASLYGRRAMDYRLQIARRNKLSANKAQGAVVQKLVEGDVSGVMTSIDIASGNRNVFVINVGPGLGESIVDGVQDADVIYVNKRTRAQEIIFGQKKSKVVLKKGGGTRVVPTSKSERENPDGTPKASITKEQAEQLSQFAGEAEYWFGLPVDIEFTIKNGIIYFLQIRPVPGFRVSRKQKNLLNQWLGLRQERRGENAGLDRSEMRNAEQEAQIDEALFWKVNKSFHDALAQAQKRYLPEVDLAVKVRIYGQVLSGEFEDPENEVREAFLSWLESEDRSHLTDVEQIFPGSPKWKIRALFHLLFPVAAFFLGGLISDALTPISEGVKNRMLLLLVSIPVYWGLMFRELYASFIYRTGIFDPERNLERRLKKVFRKTDKVSAKYEIRINREDVQPYTLLDPGIFSMFQLYSEGKLDIPENDEDAFADEFGVLALPISPLTYDSFLGQYVFRSVPSQALQTFIRDERRSEHRNTSDAEGQWLDVWDTEFYREMLKVQAKYGGHPSVPEIRVHPQGQGLQIKKIEGDLLASDYGGGWVNKHRHLSDEDFLIEVVRFVYQVASALSYLEKHGLHHGDVKYDNILITPDGHAVLKDWNDPAEPDIQRLPTLLSMLIMARVFSSLEGPFVLDLGKVMGMMNEHALGKIYEFVPEVESIAEYKLQLFRYLKENFPAVFEVMQNELMQELIFEDWGDEVPDEVQEVFLKLVPKELYEGDVESVSFVSNGSDSQIWMAPVEGEKKLFGFSFSRSRESSGILTVGVGFMDLVDSKHLEDYAALQKRKRFVWWMDKYVLDFARAAGFHTIKVNDVTGIGDLGPFGYEPAGKDYFKGNRIGWPVWHKNVRSEKRSDRPWGYENPFVGDEVDRTVDFIVEYVKKQKKFPSLRAMVEGLGNIRSAWTYRDHLDELIGMARERVDRKDLSDEFGSLFEEALQAREAYAAKKIPVAEKLEAAKHDIVGLKVAEAEKILEMHPSNLHSFFKRNPLLRYQYMVRSNSPDAAEKERRKKRGKYLEGLRGKTYRFQFGYDIGFKGEKSYVKNRITDMESGRVAIPHALMYEAELLANKIDEPTGNDVQRIGVTRIGMVLGAQKAREGEDGSSKFYGYAEEFFELAGKFPGVIASDDLESYARYFWRHAVQFNISEAYAKKFEQTIFKALDLAVHIEQKKRSEMRMKLSFDPKVPPGVGMFALSRGLLAENPNLVPRKEVRSKSKEGPSSVDAPNLSPYQTPDSHQPIIRKPSREKLRDVLHPYHWIISLGHVLFAFFSGKLLLEIYFYTRGSHHLIGSSAPGLDTELLIDGIFPFAYLTFMHLDKVYPSLLLFLPILSRIALKFMKIDPQSDEAEEFRSRVYEGLPMIFLLTSFGAVMFFFFGGTAGFGLGLAILFLNLFLNKFLHRTTIEEWATEEADGLNDLIVSHSDPKGGKTEEPRSEKRNQGLRDYEEVQNPSLSEIIEWSRIQEDAKRLVRIRYVEREEDKEVIGAVSNWRVKPEGSIGHDGQAVELTLRSPISGFQVVMLSDREHVNEVSSYGLVKSLKALTASEVERHWVFPHEDTLRKVEAPNYDRQSDFSGIPFFEKINNESVLRFEMGERFQVGYVLGEYFPRAGVYRFVKMEAANWAGYFKPIRRTYLYDLKKGLATSSMDVSYYNSRSEFPDIQSFMAMDPSDHRYAVVHYGLEFFERLFPGHAPENIAVLDDHRSLFLDPSVGLLPLEETVILSALRGMQYEQYGADEKENHMVDSPERFKREDMERRYQNVNQINFKRALKKIYERFPKKYFANAVLDALKSDISQFRHWEQPYAPHTHIGLEPSFYMEVAKQAVDGLHPTPIDMVKEIYGNEASARPLFANVAFWEFIYEEDKVMFNEIVDFFIKQEAKGWSFRSPDREVDYTRFPILLIKTFFPESYEYVHSRRSDFVPKQRSEMREVQEASPRELVFSDWGGREIPEEIQALYKSLIPKEIFEMVDFESTAFSDMATVAKDEGQENSVRIVNKPGYPNFSLSFRYESDEPNILKLGGGWIQEPASFPEKYYALETGKRFIWWIDVYVLPFAEALGFRKVEIQDLFGMGNLTRFGFVRRNASVWQKSVGFQNDLLDEFSSDDLIKSRMEKRYQKSAPKKLNQKVLFTVSATTLTEMNESYLELLGLMKRYDGQISVLVTDEFERGGSRDQIEKFETRKKELVKYGDVYSEFQLHSIPKDAERIRIASLKAMSRARNFGERAFSDVEKGSLGVAFIYAQTPESPDFILDENDYIRDLTGKWLNRMIKLIFDTHVIISRAA